MCIRKSFHVCNIASKWDNGRTPVDTQKTIELPGYLCRLLPEPQRVSSVTVRIFDGSLLDSQNFSKALMLSE